MIRYLDPLGALKWPSLLLVASPLLAYPIWLPTSAPAERCAQVATGGQAFDVYRSRPSGKLILRPTRSTSATAARQIAISKPLGFDGGGMVIPADDLRKANIDCFAGS